MNKTESIQIVEKERDNGVYSEYFQGSVVYTDVNFQQPDSEKLHYAFSYAGKANGNLSAYGESRFQNELMDAHLKKKSLENSGGFWFTEYCRNSPNITPEELLDLAEEKSWTFSDTCSLIQELEVKGAKRWIFHGNFNEYSKSFRFQILSPDAVKKVLGRLPRLRKCQAYFLTEEFGLAS